MIEPLPGNDWFVDGEVCSTDDLDWQPEDDHFDDTLVDDIVHEVAKIEVQNTDEETIAAIISDLHPRKAPAKTLGHEVVGRMTRDVERVADAPSETQVSYTAQAIVAQYYEGEGRLKKYKRRPDLRHLQRDVWIAIIRNYKALSESDRHYIEQKVGLNEYDGKPVPPKREDDSTSPRERDFRELQFKDDED